MQLKARPSRREVKSNIIQKIRKDRKKYFLIKAREDLTVEETEQTGLYEIGSLTHNYSGNCHIQVISLPDRTLSLSQYVKYSFIHGIIHKSLIKTEVSAPLRIIHMPVDQNSTIRD